MQSQPLSPEPLQGREVGGHQEASGHPGLHPCLALPTWTHLGSHETAKVIFHTSLPFCNQAPLWSPATPQTQDFQLVLRICLPVLEGAQNPPPTPKPEGTTMREQCASGVEAWLGVPPIPTCRTRSSGTALPRGCRDISGAKRLTSFDPWGWGHTCGTHHLALPPASRSTSSC